MVFKNKKEPNRLRKVNMSQFKLRIRMNSVQYLNEVMSVMTNKTNQALVE